MSGQLLGEARFRRRLREIPDRVRAQVVAAMEAGADRVVQDMRVLAPKGMSRTLVNSIAWTWGDDVPSGSITVGKLRGGGQYDRLRITIHAGRGDAFYARFHEFGTVKMPPSPFFYVAWRANRRGFRSRISRAVRRGFEKS